MASRQTKAKRKEIHADYLIKKLLPGASRIECFDPTGFKALVERRHEIRISLEKLDIFWRSSLELWNKATATTPLQELARGIHYGTRTNGNEKVLSPFAFMTCWLYEDAEEKIKYKGTIAEKFGLDRTLLATDPFDNVKFEQSFCLAYIRYLQSGSQRILTHEEEKSFWGEVRKVISYPEQVLLKAFYGIDNWRKASAEEISHVLKTDATAVYVKVDKILTKLRNKGVHGFFSWHAAATKLLEELVYRGGIAYDALNFAAEQTGTDPDELRSKFLAHRKVEVYSAVVSN